MGELDSFLLFGPNRRVRSSSRALVSQSRLTRRWSRPLKSAAAQRQTVRQIGEKSLHTYQHSGNLRFDYIFNSRVCSFVHSLCRSLHDFAAVAPGSSVELT